jgi:hypothetical protein
MSGSSQCGVHRVAARTTPCRSANKTASRCEQDRVTMRTRPCRGANKTASRCEQHRVALRPTARRTATNTVPHCDEWRAALRPAPRRIAARRRSERASRTPRCGESRFSVRQLRVAVRRAVHQAARGEHQRARTERRAAPNRVRTATTIAPRCAAKKNFATPLTIRRGEPNISALTRDSKDSKVCAAVGGRDVPNGTLDPYRCGS